MKNVALITGASAGLGKEFARIHASRKGDLIIVARREEKLIELKESLEVKYGVTVMVITKDLSHQGAAKEIYDEVTEAGVTIDYLINNAGFGGQGKFHERPFEADLAMINVNIVALTALTRYFLPGFVSRNQGKILNVSSTASFMPGPLQAVYFATKAYVTFFSNAVASELEGSNVTVTALMPTATETEFGQVSGMDKTALFNKTASARAVAIDGYRGMLEGKLDVISGLPKGMAPAMRLMTLLPKKLVMKAIRASQEVALDGDKL